MPLTTRFTPWTFTDVYNGPTVAYNNFLSVTVLYPDPLGVRVVYNHRTSW